MGKDKKNDRMLLKDNKWSIPQNKKIDLHQIYKTYLRK